MSRGTAPSLATGVEPDPTPRDEATRLRLTSNYPNPFREATVAGFSVPPELALKGVQVSVYDVTAGW